MQQHKKPRDAGLNAVKQAQRAARQGDLAAAERWTKTAERMAAAAEKLASSPEPVEAWEDEEALRAEFRERIGRYAAACKAREVWEAALEAHKIACVEALRDGRPLPEFNQPEPPTPQQAVRLSFNDFDDVARRFD